MHRNVLLHVGGVICANYRINSNTNIINCIVNSTNYLHKATHINVKYNSSASFVDCYSNNKDHDVDDDSKEFESTILNNEELTNVNFAVNDIKCKCQLEPKENDVLDLYEELEQVLENDDTQLSELAHHNKNHIMTSDNSNSADEDQDNYYVSGLEQETRVNQLPEIDDQYGSGKLRENSNSANENFWWLRDKVLVNDIPRRLPPLRIPNKEGDVVEEQKKEEEEELIKEKENLGITNKINDSETYSKTLLSNMESECEKEEKQIVKVEQEEEWQEEEEEEELELPICHPINRHSYLTQQDLLYLSYPTSPEVQISSLLHEHSNYSLVSSSSTAGNVKRTHIFAENYNCVLVVFTANDLRVHDNYALAMASAYIQEHLHDNNYNNNNSCVNTSIVGVCVIDYRTFAQPSRIGGFYRQGPERARYLLNSIAALRVKLESELHIPLLIRCGRPEEHIPRLSLELNARAVFMSTQYFPHERRVQEQMVKRLEERRWVSKAVPENSHITKETEETTTTKLLEHNTSVNNELYSNNDDNKKNTYQGKEQNLTLCEAEVNRNEPFVLETQEHVNEHPYGLEGLHQTNNNFEYHSKTNNNNNKNCRSNSSSVHETHLSWLAWCSHHPLHVHTIWQSTLVHLDDLPTPLHLMQDGERWYHDDVNVATIRRTNVYDSQIAHIAFYPFTSKHSCSLASLLLPSPDELQGVSPASWMRGRIPSLVDLGYGDVAHYFNFTEVIGTSTNFMNDMVGEEAALLRVQEWMTQGGFTSLLRYGREKRTNMKMYSIHLSKLSPFLSLGVLSPRKLYEQLRSFAQSMSRDGFAQMQFREALLRLSRRDYWHWMGLRYGDSLFYPYGPFPLDTDHIPPWRHDRAIIQKWCMGLTGIPFADAAMKELRGTGFVGFEGRKALAWLLCVGYNQDWRVGAEWFARNLLDYDPLVCYGNFAYYTNLIRDDYGEKVFDIHYIAHHHDQTGIYIKKWLPVLSKVPPVYIHRPHVLTRRMQAMHNVYLGQNYPYPIKLWDGAQETLGPHHLTCYVGPSLNTKGPGYAEAFRHGQSLLDPAEWEAFALPIPVDINDHDEEKQEKENSAEQTSESQRISSWMDLYLPSSAFESEVHKENSEGEKELMVTVSARHQLNGKVGNLKTLPESASSSISPLSSTKETTSIAIVKE